MATKTRRTADDFVRDMRARRAGTPLPPLPAPTHNTPGLPALTEQERVYCEGAREALASIRKTFDFWVAIGRGLKALHDKAEQIGGKRTYDRLREREGLGKDVINKTRSSRLIAIIDRLTEVGAWRDGLTDKQRFEWASPEAVHRHCPVFHKPKLTTSKPKPSPPVASIKPLTVDQHFAALIELLQDEPKSVVQDRLNKFAAEFERARKERRNKVPARKMTAAEAKKDAEGKAAAQKKAKAARVAGASPEHVGRRP
jgi:hypothetical protein